MTVINFRDSTYNWSCVTGLVLRKRDWPWMLLRIMVLRCVVSKSRRFGCPASWIMSLRTMERAWEELTGKKRMAVSSLCLDLTMYLVLIEDDRVDFAALLPLLWPTLRDLERSSRELWLASPEPSTGLP